MVSFLHCVALCCIVLLHDPFKGPTIGSEMSGGVQNVTFEDITLDSEELGITLKTARGQCKQQQQLQLYYPPSS